MSQETYERKKGVRNMTLFKTIDESGAESIHDCSDKGIAMQAHLIHFELPGINFKSVEIIEGNI
jgi:hypothetical protein